jgi:hypothetical protein
MPSVAGSEDWSPSWRPEPLASVHRRWRGRRSPAGTIRARAARVVSTTSVTGLGSDRALWGSRIPEVSGTAGSAAIGGAR